MISKMISIIIRLNIYHFIMVDKKIASMNSRFFIEKIEFIWETVYVSLSIIAGYNNRIKLMAGTLKFSC